jgi:hypothetical protein
METSPKADARSAQRFGPSPFLILGGIVIHPLFWLSILWGVFALSPAFRALLWRFNFAPWRHALVSVWDYTIEHPGIWSVGAGIALVHMVVRYATSHFALNDDYLFVQSGLFTFGSPGGPFRVFNDPIPFSTVLDANAQKGLLGLLTGTGTIFVSTSELQGRYLKLTWVPDVAAAQDAILTRAGVRNARIMSSIRSG